MAETNIEWTDAVWNPVAGCTRVSPGCKHCYAFALHDRRHAAHQAGKDVPRQYARPFTEVQLMPGRLDAPLHWRKPRRVFVNSMSDLFHDDVPDEFVVKCFAVMLLTRRHTYQVLTKRPERMRRIVRAPNFGECVFDVAFDLAHQWTCGGLMDQVPETDVLPNVWLGVSVEDRARKGRIDVLRGTPAAVRFLSVEPLLEDLGAVDLTGIHWAIVGGESGPGARPMHPDWARSILRQCAAAGVPFFFKQHGEWHPCCHESGHTPGDKERCVDGLWMLRVGKKAAGRLLDGKEHSEFPRGALP